MVTKRKITIKAEFAIILVSNKIVPLNFIRYISFADFVEKLHNF